MTKELPHGNEIGRMQAPAQWIHSHTVRFVGIARITIQGGEGFIIINKGKALAYYFRHGKIELRGNAALDYFNSHTTIEFRLCKYTPEELARAMKICNIIEPADSRVMTADMDLFEDISPEVLSASSTMESSYGATHETETHGPTQPVNIEKLPDVNSSVPAPNPFGPRVNMMNDIPESDQKIISRVGRLNSVIAVFFLTAESQRTLKGEDQDGTIVDAARGMLAMIGKHSSGLVWGSFVHMTMRIPEGNIIVAPYAEGYLCLVMASTTNIGHIRRFLKDIKD